MGIFKRNKKEEAFKIQLEREAIEQLNHPEANANSFLPQELRDEPSSLYGDGKAKAPHAITAEELNGQLQHTSPSSATVDSVAETITMTEDSTAESSSDFLYKRMTETRRQATERAVIPPAHSAPSNPVVTQPTIAPEPKAETVNIDSLLQSLHSDLERAQSNLFSHHATSSPEPIPTVATEISPSPTKQEEIAEIPMSKGDLVSPPTAPIPPIDPTAAKRAEERRTSLLARCNAYLKDEESALLTRNSEKYKLESVESILQDFEKRASRRARQTLETPRTSNFTTPTSAPISQATLSFSSPTVTKPKQNTEKPADVKHFFTAPSEEIHQIKETKDTLAETKVLPNRWNETNEISSSSDKTTVFPAVKEVSNTSGEPKEEPMTEPLDAPEEPFDDYRTPADRDRIYQDLKKRRKRFTGRILLNLLLFLPALALCTPLGSWLQQTHPAVYTTANLAIAALAIPFNLNAIRAIGSLFASKTAPELPSGLAAISVLLYHIIASVRGLSAYPLCVVSVFSLLLGNIAGRCNYSRVIRNFNCISDASEKKAVAIVKSRAATQAMVGNSIDGNALVCLGANTTHIRDFLKYTYTGDPVSPKITLITRIGLISAVLLGLLSGFLSGNVWPGFFAFTVLLCITAAPATLWLSFLPFSVAESRLRLYDAMLTGYRASEELDLCNAIAVHCSDLFPKGSIRLVDLKLLSPNPIDQSMLDAAALTEAMQSPLAGIFEQMNSSDYSHQNIAVDTVVYEDKMGVSGWVNNRRVFVGNRVLMEAHGFTNLPPIELDKKIMRKGYFPVYLASDNVPCALLIVKYTPNQEIAYELRRLCNTGTTVLVHNCDPNISNQMLCHYFGLYSESIAIMSKQGSVKYQECLKPRPSMHAGASYRGSVSGLFAILTASIHIKRSTQSMILLYVFAVILGILAVGVSIFTPLSTYIRALSLLIYQLVTTLIICLPPLMKRP